MKLAKIIGFVLLAICSAQAEIKPEADYHDLIKNFFLVLDQGNDGAANALAGFIATSPVMSLEQPSTIAAFPIKFQESMRPLGKCSGYDIVTDTLVTPHVAYVIGLANFDAGPARMEFMFYKSNDKWIFYSFTYNIAPHSEIRAASKQTMFVEPPPKGGVK